MNHGAATAALERAAEISRELTLLADGGEAQATQRRDAERMQLLRSARNAVGQLSDRDRALLREIADLNDRAIRLLEHRQRGNARDMDLLSVGKRALRAYASAGAYR